MLESAVCPSVSTFPVPPASVTSEELRRASDEPLSIDDGAGALVGVINRTALFLSLSLLANSKRDELVHM